MTTSQTTAEPTPTDREREGERDKDSTFFRLQAKPVGDRWEQRLQHQRLRSPIFESSVSAVSLSRLRWGHNRLVSISHIRVIIVKWDNDLVLRWHLFIFLNFAVLIFQETHIKHNTAHGRSSKKKKEREGQNTCMYTLSLGCGTSRSGNDHQSSPSESTASIWLCFYCQCNVTILDLRFQLNANRLLTICIRRTIDQSIGLINMIYYSTQRYRKGKKYSAIKRTCEHGKHLYGQ